MQCNEFFVFLVSARALRPSERSCPGPHRGGSMHYLLITDRWLREHVVFQGERESLEIIAAKLRDQDPTCEPASPCYRASPIRRSSFTAAPLRTRALDCWPVLLLLRFPSLQISRA